MLIALNYSLRPCKPELCAWKLVTAGREHNSTFMLSHLWFELKAKTEDEAEDQRLSVVCVRAQPL